MGDLDYIVGLQPPTVVHGEYAKEVWSDRHLLMLVRSLLRTNDSKLTNKEKYQSAVGSLLYLSPTTKPDITFAVNSVAKFSANPTEGHWTAAKRIFRYLKGTVNYGLIYSCDLSPAQIGQVI